MGIVRPTPQATPGAAIRGEAGTADVVAVLALLGAVLLSIGAGVAPVSAASGAPRVTSAESFACRVLGEAIVPPGARSTKVVRSELLDEPFQMIGIGGLVDVHRFYLVDGPAGAVADYLEAHLPRGATQVAEGSVGAAPDVAPELAYALPASGPHEYLAELAYVVAAVGRDVVEFRVDAQVVWEPSRPVAERAPATGVVQVTGYSGSSAEGGSSGPVTFTVSGARARSLLSALNGLPLGPRGWCLEKSLLFRIVVRPARGAPPSFDADGWACAGDVLVTAHGRVLPDLYDAHCLLLRAVVAVLPACEAYGTRAARTGCDPRPAAVPAHGSGISASAFASLTKIALDMAADNGDARPRSVVAVATTHAVALAIATPGDLTPTVPAGERVYLVVMRGSFTGYEAAPPSGAVLPTGSYLSFVVSEKTFRVTDWGLGAIPPPRPLPAGRNRPSPRLSGSTSRRPRQRP